MAVVESLDLEIVREFAAPRALVFRAFTEPELMRRWHGPKGAPLVELTGEVREGENWTGLLRNSETGEEFPQGGRWLKIQPEERFEWTFGWADGPERRIVAIFEDLGDRTRMVFRQYAFDSAVNRDHHVEGWTSTFERLEELLADIA